MRVLSYWITNSDLDHKEGMYILYNFLIYELQEKLANQVIG